MRARTMLVVVSYWRRMERRIEAEYRRVLESPVEFGKRIRDRLRRKYRANNERIAELERRSRVA